MVFVTINVDPASTGLQSCTVIALFSYGRKYIQSPRQTLFTGQIPTKIEGDGMPFYELYISFNFVNGTTVQGPNIPNVIGTFSLGPINGVPFAAVVLSPPGLHDYTITILNSQI